MERTTIVAEWHDEDNGLVVTLSAAEFISALHAQDELEAAAPEIFVALPQRHSHVVQHVV